MSTKDIFFSEIVSFKLIPRKLRMHFWQPWWNRFHEKPKYSAQCPEVIKVHLQAKGMLFPSNFPMYAWISVLTNPFQKSREEAETFQRNVRNWEKRFLQKLWFAQGSSSGYVESSFDESTNFFPANRQNLLTKNSKKITKFFFGKPRLLQNVPMHTQNAVLTNPAKKFQSLSIQRLIPFAQNFPKFM